MNIFNQLWNKAFICECKERHPLTKIKTLQHCSISGNSRVVGRCMNCGKRQYGTIIYANLGIREQ